MCFKRTEKRREKAIFVGGSLVAYSNVACERPKWSLLFILDSQSLLLILLRFFAQFVAVEKTLGLVRGVVSKTRVFLCSFS